MNAKTGGEYPVLATFFVSDTRCGYEISQSRQDFTTFTLSCSVLLASNWNRLVCVKKTDSESTRYHGAMDQGETG